MTAKEALDEAQKRLEESGCLDIKFTWNPDQSKFSDEDRMQEMADMINFMLDGKFTELDLTALSTWAEANGIQVDEALKLSDGDLLKVMAEYAS